jgi:drug/metabolite transporter (DMT)-like permease
MPSAKKSTHSYHTLAIFSLIGVAFGYAVLGMNSRLLNVGFAPSTQVYVRVLVGFILSLIIFGRSLRWSAIKTIPNRDKVWLLLMGVFGYAGSVLFATLASLNTKLVNASVIGATAPFIVYIYSYFFLKEKVRPIIIMNLLIAMYSVVVIASKSFTPMLGNFGIGEFYAVCSVLSLGWWSVGRQKLSNHLYDKEITMVTMLIAGLTALFVALVRGESLNLHAFSLPPVMIGITVGAILNLALTYMETFAFKHVNLVFGNQLLMTSTVFSLLGGLLFYQEFVTLPEIVGGLIILSTVWYANSLAKK